MILFISAWHLGIVLGVVGFVLATCAFIGVSALLWFLWDIWQQIEDEKSGAEQRKRDRRSAGAKQGWRTRKAKRPMIAEQLSSPPTCPNCGSEDGSLGTSNAYFMCRNPECLPERRREGWPSLEVYYLGDGLHPNQQGKEWRDAVLASPWGRQGSGARYFDEITPDDAFVQPTALASGQRRGEDQ